MDAKTAEALEKSIAHWDELTRVERMIDINVGPNSCALCRLFNPIYTKEVTIDACEGCPVEKSTGNFGCIGTPYEECDNIIEEWDGDGGHTDAEYIARFRAAAIAERDFLISLREKK